MTKTITALSLCLILFAGTQTIHAQDKTAETKKGEPAFSFDPPSIPDEAEVYPQEGKKAVLKDGKYGFKVVDGAMVIPYKYEDVNWFSHGMASVKLNGKWGYINRKDKPVIPFKYEDAGIFSEGLAPVKLHGKWGFINIKNEVVIPFKYENARSFSEGLAAVKKMESGVILIFLTMWLFHFSMKKQIDFLRVWPQWVIVIQKVDLSTQMAK